MREREIGFGANGPALARVYRWPLGKGNWGRGPQAPREADRCGSGDSDKPGSWAISSGTDAHLILTQIVPKVTARLAFSPSHCREERVQFLVHLFRSVHSLSDFSPKELPIAAAEAMDCHFDRLFTHAELIGNISIGADGAIAGQGAFQGIKQG